MSDTPPNFPPAPDNQPGSASTSGSGGFPPNEPTGFGTGQASSYNTPPSGGGSGFTPPPPPPGQSFGQEQYVPPPLTPETPPNKRNRNILLIVGGVLAALLLCCCIGGLVLTRMGQTAVSDLEEELETLSTPEAGNTSGDDGPFDDGTSGDGDTNENVLAESMSVGDCFSVGGGSTETTNCSNAHDYEVFHVFDLPDGSNDPFPGDDELDVVWEPECIGSAFEDYVGLPYEESVFGVSALEPTAESWEGGDREVLCVLYEPDTQLEGSMQGSDR